MKEEKKFYPSFNDSIWLMIRMMVVAFVISMPMLAFFFITQEVFHIEGEQLRSIFFLLAYALPIFIIIRLALQRIRQWSKADYRLSFNILPASSFLLIILTGLSLVVVLDPIESLVPIPDIFIESYFSMVDTDFFSFLTIVVAAPVLEEVLFRGIILEGFLHNYAPRKAILLSALLFAGIHLNPVQMIGAFFIGIFLGWIYWKTRTLLPVIALHFMNNLLAFLFLAVYGKQTAASATLLDTPAYYWMVIIAGGLIGAAGIWLLQKRFRKNEIV